VTEYKPSENENAFCYVPADVPIPELYAQDGKGDDAIVWLKWFFPAGSWTWYITEYDPKERIAFGLCCGDFPELGYVSLAEIESLEVRRLRVERDIWWSPKTMGEVRRELG
jgi:hypothetical protein